MLSEMLVFANYCSWLFAMIVYFGCLWWLSILIIYTKWVLLWVTNDYLQLIPTYKFCSFSLLAQNSFFLFLLDGALHTQIFKSSYLSHFLSKLLQTKCKFHLFNYLQTALNKISRNTTKWQNSLRREKAQPPQPPLHNNAATTLSVTHQC